LLYILYGADDFSLRGRVNELKKGWGDEESLAINTTQFEAAKLTPDQLIGACDSPPFLGENRLVIVDGLLGRFERREGTSAKSKSLKSDEWQALVDYAARIPPSTQLVLLDGPIAKNNPLLKKLAPNAKIQEFPLPKGAKLQQWVQSRVAEYGVNISPRAAKLLVESVGENLWALANELEKLSLYAIGRRIEEEDVKQLTSYTRDTNVFAMVDAIVERRAPAAMQTLHQLLDDGMAPPYLLVMITRQLRLMVQAKDLIAQKVPVTGMTEELGLSPYYPIDRLLKQAKGYSMPRLVEVYRKLLETDISIKTGKWKGDLALELLIAEVCS